MLFEVIVNRALLVENLSKRYIIGHQRREKYLTLRDVLANKTKNLGGRFLQLLRNCPGEKSVKWSSKEEFWALKNVSFEIQQGDRVGIIGRNGAGKSTLLKILSRITDPTEGCITIRGRVSSLLEVGTGFHPELTGRENIFLNGAILGMTRADIKGKFDEIVAFAEIDRFLDTPVKRYSSGMYVRLAFAVAAHLEPEILIVDEVLAVGDAQFQKKCLGKMEEVGKEGRTVLFVSHNMASIQQLTTKGLLLTEGKVEFFGAVQKTISNYLERNNICTEEIVTDVTTNDENLVLKKISVIGKNNVFDYEAPLVFSVWIYASINFTEVNIAVGVFNSLSCRLLTAKNIIKKLKPGLNKATLEIENHNLPPGAYSISLGISTPLTMIFYKEKLISFSISDLKVNDPLLIPYLSHQQDKIGAFYQLKTTMENL